MRSSTRGFLVALAGVALAALVVADDARAGEALLDDRSRRGLAWTAAITVLAAGTVGALLARADRADERGERRIQWTLLTLVAVSSAAALLAGVAVIFDLARIEPFRAPVAWLLAIATALGTGIAYSPPAHPDVVRPLRWLIELAALAAIGGLMWFGFATLVGAASPTTLEPGPAVALVASTVLVIAALHDPLRRATRLFVFGGPPPDVELVAAFSGATQSALSPEEVLELLTRTAVDGVRVRWARARLRSAGGELIAVAATGIEGDDPSTPALRVELRHGDAEIGALECGPGRDGSLSDRDRAALAALGRHAALGVVTARQLAQIQAQTGELMASRARLVQAQEVERRRIERDLHDGAQQQLIALIAKMRLVRAQLERDPAIAAATLTEAQDEARLALDDLRRLVHGIHPPVLSDRGLVDAVESLASRHLVSVQVDAAPSMRGRRFGTDIEGAAFFVVSEALANSVKHAGASGVRIGLRSTDRQLEVDVADDGIGFEPAAVANHGLDNLRDRLAAVGGFLAVESGSGAGTRLQARIPVPPADLLGSSDG